MVVVRSIQVKSCSVMEMQLTVCFVCFRPSCFRAIYQFLVYFQVVGNHAQRVKYLHRVDVNIDCRTLNIGTGNLLGLLKGKCLSP